MSVRYPATQASRPERVRVNPQVVSRYIDARRDLQAGRYPMRAIRYATGFVEILEVQVLGYRERLTSLRGGGRQRVLDPVWTLILKVEAA